MQVSVMTKPQIMTAIGTLQGVQKSNPPRSREWQETSLILRELYAEMARREPCES